jgi:hypothetical protein
LKKMSAIISTISFGEHSLSTLYLFQAISVWEHLSYLIISQLRFTF